MSPLVLVTGATGHVGFAVLIATLKSGYRVRAAVRSAAKASVISSNPVVKSLNLPTSSLTFVTVPDLTLPGAYDSAAQDVDYIIHVASPIHRGMRRRRRTINRACLNPRSAVRLGFWDPHPRHPLSNVLS